MEPILQEPARDEGADEFYDFLARQRWSRPGHSGRPEPFTAIHQGEDLGNMWLGGLPTNADIPFLERQWITLIVGARRRQHKNVVVFDIVTLFRCLLLLATMVRNVRHLGRRFAW